MSNTLSFREMLKLRLSILLKKGVINFASSDAHVNAEVWRTFKFNYGERLVSEAMDELENDLINEAEEYNAEIREIPEDFKIE